MSLSLLNALNAAIKEEVPGYATVPKADSWLQKAIGKLLFFNPAYMEHYTTTFYPKVYLSASSVWQSDRSFAALLSHEFVHLYDNKQRRLGFPLGYLFPQILALGALGAFWHVGFLVFLLALAPWPAYWRMKAELRGYAMNMAIQYWLTGVISPAYKQIVTSYFTGWSYYRMWPDAADVDARLAQLETAIRSGAICDGEAGKPYRIVRRVLDQQGLRRSE